MSKRLYLLRHAIALSGSSDKERSLAPKGIEDAEVLGKVMAQKSYAPSLALCSAAARTKETLAGVRKSFEGLASEELDVLYNASAGTILEKIQGVSADVAAVLVVAHNPGIHLLAGQLSGEGSPTLLRHLAIDFRPATLAVLDCPCESWADLAAGENALVDLLEPLDYNAPSTPARWT